MSHHRQYYEKPKCYKDNVINQEMLCSSCYVQSQRSVWDKTKKIVGEWYKKNVVN